MTKKDLLLYYVTHDVTHVLTFFYMLLGLAPTVAVFHGEFVGAFLIPAIHLVYAASTAGIDCEKLHNKYRKYIEHIIDFFLVFTSTLLLFFFVPWYTALIVMIITAATLYFVFNDCLGLIHTELAEKKEMRDRLWLVCQHIHKQKNNS